MTTATKLRFAGAILAVLLVFLLDSTHAECVTKTCPLSPFESELALRNQVFCSADDDNTGAANKLKRTGSDCSDLAYCCAVVDDFRSAQAESAIRIIGVSQSVDEVTGVLSLPPGRTMRIEFAREACVARIRIGTIGMPRGAVRLTRYYLSAATGTALESTDYPLGSASSEIVLDECHVLALAVSSPVDLALRVDDVSFCLLDSESDACGVCNGDGNTCGASESATGSIAVPKPDMRDVAVRKRSVSTEESADVAAADAVVASTLTSSSALALSQEELWNADYAADSAHYPIVPHVRCHQKLENNMCFTVFGYENRNNITVYIPAEHNRFLPKPAYRGQPCYFIPGGEDAAFGVVWNCTAHRQVYMSWSVVSSTTQRAGLWPHRATVHRRYARGCPEELSEII